VRAGARQELTQPTQRLAKWFTTLSPKDKAKIIKDVSQLVLARRTRMCNFLEYKGRSHRVPHLRTNPQADGLCTRFKSCLPPLRFALFHRRLRFRRQRAHHTRDCPPLCRADGQVLRQCLRARHYLQLPKSILHLGRATASRRDAREQQEECTQVYRPARQSGRHGGTHIFPCPPAVASHTLLSLQTFDAAFHPSPHRFRPSGICQRVLTLNQVEDEAVTRIM
jgi:hypothetical protein